MIQGFSLNRMRPKHGIHPSKRMPGGVRLNSYKK